MIKAQASSTTATGDTVKTAIGTSIQVPMTAKSIVGIWCYAVGGPGMTTLENASGIFELESSDKNLQPLQLPLDIVTALTSGSAAFSPRIFPANIPVSGGEVIKCYVTMDMSMTVALLARWGLIYEAD
jgi:hypothetical protein